jgi:hypothetical protein
MKNMQKTFCFKVFILNSNLQSKIQEEINKLHKNVCGSTRYIDIKSFVSPKIIYIDNKTFQRSDGKKVISFLKNIKLQ